MRKEHARLKAVLTSETTPLLALNSTQGDGSAGLRWTAAYARTSTTLVRRQWYSLNYGTQRLGIKAWAGVGAPMTMHKPCLEHSQYARGTLRRLLALTDHKRQCKVRA